MAVFITFVLPVLVFVSFSDLTRNVEAETTDKERYNKEWLITREMWGARNCSDVKIKENYLPIRLAVIHHTDSAECHSISACVSKIRKLQSHYLDVLNQDIPYNFIIGNDKRVYESRGWGKVGAHTLNYNECSLGLAFVGTSQSKVTSLQEMTAHKLLHQGVKLGYLHRNIHVLGTEDFQLTESPGSELHDTIRKWSNYDHINVYKYRTCDERHAILKK